MQTILVLLCFIASISLSCSPKNDDKKTEGVLTAAQEKTLKKAKETEQLLKKADEERLKTLDEAQGQ